MDLLGVRSNGSHDWVTLIAAIDGRRNSLAATADWRRAYIGDEFHTIAILLILAQPFPIGNYC